MRVRLLKDGFRLHKGWFRQTDYNWSEVRTVLGIWGPHKACHNLSLILVMRNGQDVMINEFAPGFDSLEAHLPHVLTGWFPDWRERCEDQPTGERFILWGEETPFSRF